LLRGHHFFCFGFPALLLTRSARLGGARPRAEKFLQRSDDISSLVEKTEGMNIHSETFRMQSRQLRKNLCWANLKTKLIAIILFLVRARMCPPLRRAV
jgi:hypothetical protein